MESYKTSEVLKLLKLNRNTFQDWLDRGFVSPSVSQSTKKGETSLFSTEDLYIISIFDRLCKAGFYRATAAGLLKSVRAWLVKEKAELLNFSYIVISIRLWDAQTEDIQISILKDKEDIDVAISSRLFPTKNDFPIPPDEVIIINIHKAVRYPMSPESEKARNEMIERSKARNIHGAS